MNEKLLREKVQNAAEALKAQFLERDRVVEGMVVALLARQHVLLLGPPGTAKSALANALTQAVADAEQFQWLLTRYSTPEEVFGPVSLSALKQDQFKRVTKGKLPEAVIAFLDEIFKANSAILNALLTAINERKYHNNGGAMDIPLEMLVGASNELPEGGTAGELAPLYDRFLLRFWIEPLKSDGNFIDLLSDEDSEGGDISLGNAVGSMLTLEELKDAQVAAGAVSMPRATAERMAELRRELAQKGITASDRRWKQAVSALRANAWLSGDTEVSDDHFTVLADCLWDDPEQRREVAVAVQAFCGQQVGEALKIHDSIVELINNLPPGGKEREGQVTRVTAEGRRADEELARLQGDVTSDGNKRAIERLQAQLTAALAPIRKETMKSLGL
jgi:MoxR-like ATPase